MDKPYNYLRTGSNPLNFYNKPLFKTYYRGDTINIIGYVRPPLKYFNSANQYLLSY